MSNQASLSNGERWHRPTIHRPWKSNPRRIRGIVHGFEVFNNFLRENVGIGKIGGFFKVFVSEPEDVEVALPRLM